MKNCQKIKLLKLMELLRQDTDEQHPLSTNELCAALGEMGITCDRRTLASDIRLLNDEGYEIMPSHSGRQNAYYIADRSFSAPELRVLSDAVQAAGFITEKKTAELIDKIAALGGNHRAELMKGSMVCFNTRKHSNESILYNIDALDRAIVSGLRACFRYFDLDEHHQRIYRGTERYVVDPAALVYMDDNYYLLTYSEKRGGITTYRIDRMDKVDVLEEPISAKAKEAIASLDLPDHTTQAFRMFSGERKDVTLRFHRRVLGAVYDKFGEKLEVHPIEGDMLCIRVNVQVSPTFFGWLCQFAGNMELTGPQSVIDDYCRHLRTALGAAEGKEA